MKMHLPYSPQLRAAAEICSRALKKTTLWKIAVLPSAIEGVLLFALATHSSNMTSFIAQTSAIVAAGSALLVFSGLAGKIMAKNSTDKIEATEMLVVGVPLLAFNILVATGSHLYAKHNVMRAADKSVARIERHTDASASASQPKFVIPQGQSLTHQPQ